MTSTNVAYHVSPRRNRRSIRRHGLLPRCTVDHHFPFATENRGDYVFVFLSYWAAIWWVLKSREEPGVYGQTDLWRVDVSGVALEADPVSDTSATRRSRRTAERLGPERLELVRA